MRVMKFALPGIGCQDSGEKAPGSGGGGDDESRCKVHVEICKYCLVDAKEEYKR